MTRTDTTPTVLVPDNDAHIHAVAAQCRDLVNSRALAAAAVSLVPVPGLHWLADAGVLMQLIPCINEAFGLTPDQVAKLAPNRQVVVYKVVSAGGGMIFGKVITQQVLLRMLEAAGVRLTVRERARFVPVVGRFVFAAMTFATMRYVCEKHIEQCIAVCQRVKEHPADAVAALEPATPATALQVPAPT